MKAQQKMPTVSSIIPANVSNLTTQENSTTGSSSTQKENLPSKIHNFTQITLKTRQGHLNQNLVHCPKDIHIFTLYRNIIIIYYRFCHTILLLLILLIIILTTIIRSDFSFRVFIMQNHTKSKSSLITRIHHP